MRTSYRAGLVLPMDRDDPGFGISQGCVTVEDGRIVFAGELRDAPAELGTPFDLGDDVTLLPGLIDTHVHLCFDGSDDPVSRVRTAGDRAVLATMLQNARELLSVGVTTARDLGAPDLLDRDASRAIGSGIARGPRLLTATAPLTVTGGHCWFFGAECDGEEGVRRAVRQARKHGADVIKVMATGGNLTPGTFPSEPQYTEAELAAIVDEAHRLGLRVTAHAHGTEGIRRAVAAGVDSLEHFSFQQPDGTMVENAEVVDETALAGVYVCKTLCAAWRSILVDDHALPEDMLRRLVDRGVKVVAGTDAGITLTPHREYVFGLEGMAAFGLSEPEVLDAATRLAAESIGLAEVTGRLRAGLAADLLGVRGDPRSDLATLRNVVAVVAEGRPYTPEFSSTLRWNDHVHRPKYRPGTTPQPTTRR